MVRVLASAVERIAARRHPEQVAQRVNGFFAQAGVDRSALCDMHARIPLAAFKRVVRAAHCASGEPALGLYLAEHSSLSTFDVIGVLVEQSDTLRDALATALRYQHIMTAHTVVEIAERGDSAIISLHLPDASDPEGRFGAELATAGLLRAVRMFVGPDALPRRTAFSYPRPLHVASYDRTFGDTARFSQPYTGLEIERGWLDRRKPGRSDELRAYIKTRADYLLAKADQRMATTDRVRRWLAAQPIAARMSMDAIARDLGTSQRSLRRRLHDEQVQWSALLDEALAGHAKRLLSDPHRSVEETAFSLGFTTASAFSRAFKRWTGKPPRDFRG